MIDIHLSYCETKMADSSKIRNQDFFGIFLCFLVARFYGINETGWRARCVNCTEIATLQLCTHLYWLQSRGGAGRMATLVMTDIMRPRIVRFC